MAGGGSAYVRLEKPDNSISQGLQYWGGITAQQGAEFRARREREQLRKNQQMADWEKQFGYKYDDFKSKVTGFDTYDQIKADYANKVADAYVDLNRKALEAMTKGDNKARRDYEMQMLRLKGSFKQVAEGDALMSKLNQDYVKKVQEGKMSGVDADNWEAEMESILKDKNYEISIDKNGSPMILGIKKLQDGSEEPFQVSFSDVVNGNWRPYDKQQIAGKGGIVEGILQNLGKAIQDKKTGNIITTNQVWDKTRETATNGYIDALLESDEVMADLYYQMTDGRSRKRNNFTEEEKKEVHDKLFEMVRGGYSETSRLKVDTQEARLDETKRANKVREGLQRDKLEEDIKARIEGNKLKEKALDLKGNNKPKLSKAERKEADLRAKSALAYKIAKEISEAPLNDKSVKEIADKYGLDFNSDWNLFNETWNEFDIAGQEVEQTAVHQVAQAIAADMGYDYDRTYVDKDLQDELEKPATTVNNSGSQMSDSDYEKFLKENGLN